MGELSTVLMKKTKRREMHLMGPAMNSFQTLEQPHRASKSKY